MNSYVLFNAIIYDDRHYDLVVMISSLILFPSEQFFPTPEQNRYYMESLKIIDKFCSSYLAFFLNMAHIFMHSQEEWKDVSSSLRCLSP